MQGDHCSSQQYRIIRKKKASSQYFFTKEEQKRKAILQSEARTGSGLTSVFSESSWKRSVLAQVKADRDESSPYAAMCLLSEVIENVPGFRGAVHALQGGLNQKNTHQQI